MFHRLRGLAVALGAGFVLASVAHAGPLEDAARDAGRPLIVRFGMERCLQCIKQSQAFDELEPKYENQMVFRFVHIGQEEEMVEAYKVLLIPTVLFFNSSGKEVFRHVGYLAAEELEAAFRSSGLAGVTAGG